jgi:hypothetical protein
MAHQEVATTQIAHRLQQAMDRENLSLHDMTKEFDMSYEYMRRVSKGINLPSKTVLKLFSHRFRWDYAEMEKLLVQDRFRMKNGVQGAIAQEFDPEVEPFEKCFRLLDESQKKILLAQLNLFVTQNRRHNRGGLNATGS